MMKTILLATVLLLLAGCTQTGISAADAKNAYGPQPSESEIERELKKEGNGKWEEYQKIKERDAAVEADQRAANANSNGNDVQQSADQK